MGNGRIALQLYTIRDKLEAPQNYSECLSRVKKMGYDGVEGNAIDPVIDVDEYARILAGEGLACCSNHAMQSDLEDRYPQVVERAKTLGCATIVFASLDRRYWSAEGVKSIAQFLDATGARLKADGIRFLYHNHHMEFQKIGGRTILEVIYALTDPSNMGAELDTYWIQYAGASPVNWLKRMKGRTNHLHCDDLGVVESESSFMEIGEGNLDWTAIVRTAKQCGIEWFIVEQGSSRRDTLESARMSCRALQRLLDVDA